MRVHGRHNHRLDLGVVENMKKWRKNGMETKAIVAAVMAAFIVGAAIWLHVRRKKGR